MANMSKEKIDRAVTGMWGGTHIGLQATAEGASLEFDCAHGAINQPIVVDDRGRFNVQGTYTAESHGPIRQGREPKDSPARYTGSVSGDTMTLTVVLADTTETNDTFTLVRGKEGKIWKCK